jgi:hypothetical protein
LISVIQNLSTGQRRELPRPIYAIHPNGKEAISLNFHRLQAYRPGYGYHTAMADNRANWAPSDDGLWRINLQTGRDEFIYSIADAKAFHSHPAADVPNWFNHVTYNTDGSRFCFLHRFRYEDRGTGPWITRLITMKPDGSEPFLLGRHEMVSHYAWEDSSRLIAWARYGTVNSKPVDRYFVFTDQTDYVETIGDGVLMRDGHMTYSPDRQWLLTDEYPGSDGKQPLILFHLATERRIEIGRFQSNLKGEIRCDLHPRWNRDGTQICFDSTHHGTRQVYVVDVRETV